MPRKKESPGIHKYYSALEQIFQIQSDVLTGVLTHLGERGRNDEEMFRQFLRKILPNRFGVSTGFIVCSNPNKEPSNQTDVVICDQFFNSPIYRELAGEVHPIETVCAIVEVKGTLSRYRRKDGKTDIARTLEAITKVRRLAEHKSYVKYVPVFKRGNKKSGAVAVQKKVRIELPPRAYLFAYGKKGWKDLISFENEFRNELKKYPEAHIHGIAILRNNWFVHQEAYAKDPQTLHSYDDNCLLRFTNALLHGVQSMPMLQIDIDEYHKQGMIFLHDIDRNASYYDGKIDQFD